MRKISEWVFADGGNVMKKEQKWEFVYAVLGADGEEKIKVCYPRSEEQKKENALKCEKLGYRVVSVKKLYPFNTEKNQHNFFLISNICKNSIWDMECGCKEYDAAEIERLEKLQEKADRLMELDLPVAWIPWEEWQDAKQLSDMAVLHRQECCVANGRYDLISYC